MALPCRSSCTAERRRYEGFLGFLHEAARDAMQMRRVFRHAEAAALDALSAKVWSELLTRYAGQPEAA